MPGSVEPAHHAHAGIIDRHGEGGDTAAPRRLDVIAGPGRQRGTGGGPADPWPHGPADREEALRDAVRIAVDDQARAGLDRISDGETLLWDDTFPHEVMNNSDEPRIALLLDVWRPHMPVDMEILSRLIVGAVQIGMKYRGRTSESISFSSSSLPCPDTCTCLMPS